MAERNAISALEPLYRTAIVWDAHSCLPLAPGIDMSGLERHRAAGATFVHINVGMDYNPVDQVIEVIAGYRSWLIEHSSHFVLVESVDDILKAKKENKLAVAFDLEGSVMLRDNLSMLRLYRDLGVRQIHLAYNRNNSIAGGCYDQDPGLSDLGRRVVVEINKLGILMDCSHMGERSSLDVMEISTKPVVFSHSNVHAICQHPRNISDDQISACARTDGVVGICGIGPYIGDNDVSTESLLRHIDYVSECVGPRHVGLGLDYVFDAEHKDMPDDQDHDYWYPGAGGLKIGEMRFKPPEDLPEIADALSKRGYSETELRGILGENFLRVARQTWVDGI